MLAEFSVLKIIRSPKGILILMSLVQFRTSQGTQPSHKDTTLNIDTQCDASHQQQYMDTVISVRRQGYGEGRANTRKPATNFFDSYELVRVHMSGKVRKSKRNIRKISIYSFTCLLFEKIEGFFVLHSS